MVFKHEDMPYFSQWISRELVGDIIAGRLPAEEDPLWKSSGAESPADYEFWAKNICGMACLRMILAYRGMEAPPLVQMAKECAAAGGYKVRGDGIEGLYYDPFVKYISLRFGLEGRTKSPLSLEEIVKGTLEGHIFVVSVHYSLREALEGYDGPRGGHLVVVSGVDTKGNCLYINNPSGDRAETQRNFKIGFDLFRPYFAGRGILIKSSG